MKSEEKNKWQKMNLTEFKRAIADPARDAKQKAQLAGIFRQQGMK